MTVRSAWLLDTGQSRQDTRLSPTGVFTPTSPLAARSGIVPGSADGATLLAGFTASGSSAMAVTVYPGRAVVQTSDVQGAYPVALTDPVTLTVPDGDPQYARIDLVVLRIYDNLFDASGRDEASIELVTGTPAAAPVPPVAPAASLPLHQIAVPAGVSAGSGGIAWSTALTGLRTPTVAAGGILPVVADLAPGAYPGQYRDTGGGLQRWDGSAWQPYPPVPAWQDWTPQWTTDNGPVAFGNAALTCRYVQHGPIVHLSFNVVFGTTTDFGTGSTLGENWHFSLPVPLAAPAEAIGFAGLNGPSTALGRRLVARIRCAATTDFQLEINTGRVDATPVSPTGLADSSSPWTWAAGDSIYGTATYEAAV